MANEIQQKLLVVRLHISKWNPWGYDKETAKRVAQEEGAKQGDVHTTKRKISKDAIKKITDIMSSVYAYHLEMTMPSGTEGDRLITIDFYDKYCGKMGEYKNQLNAALDEFVLQYPTWVTEASERLKGLFKEADYPATDQIRGKFSIIYNFLPLPSADNLTVNLMNGQLSQLRKSVEEEMNRISETAMGSLWDRIHKNVARMAEKLGDNDAIFRNSLIGNVKDLCEVLKSLNFSNDPELEAMRLRIETRLAGRDPEELRKSRNIREEVARDAKAIVVEISEKRKLRVE